MPEEEKVYTSMYSRNAELYHHGILGMKWGLRNGPPYPLGSDVSTGSRLKKIFSRDKGGEEVKKTEEEKAQIARAKALKKENKKMLKESKRDTVTSRAVKKAKVMTDEELRAAVNRLNFEKQYANLEKDLAELNKQNPTLGQKVKSSIKKTLKEQIRKTGTTVLNSVTQEINKKISDVIKDRLDQKLEIGEYKPKKDKESGSSDNKEDNTEGDKEKSSPSESKLAKAFEFYKERYKEGWNGDNWYKDPVTKEPKMNRKEREAAAEVKRTAEYKDSVAESLRQMYEDPNYEQYKETIFRQYAQSVGAADKYRKENQETIDKLDRQYPNYKYKKKK